MGNGGGEAGVAGGGAVAGASARQVQRAHVGRNVNPLASAPRSTRRKTKKLASMTAVTFVDGGHFCDDGHFETATMVVMKSESSDFYMLKPVGE